MIRDPVLRGAEWCEPFAHLDLATSSWRTSQLCLVEAMDSGSELFSGTWPRSGTMQSGTAYRRPPLVPITSATAYSSLPTQRTSQYKNRFWRHRADYKGNLEEWGGLMFPEIIGQPINPRWLEWHMGFSDGWTLLEDSETP